MKVSFKNVWLYCNDVESYFDSTLFSNCCYVAKKLLHMKGRHDPAVTGMAYDAIVASGEFGNSHYC